MKSNFSAAPPRAFSPYDGVLLVDKPAGITSHDVVDGIRRHFHFEKVGHGGTLDPMATGLLVILLGRGTKLSERIMGSDKVYEGVMRLGVTTDTQDADGTVTAEAECGAVTRAQVEEQFRCWTGDVWQTPPMVSAIKKDGVPLYKLARKGQEIERQPRLLHIYQFVLTEFAPPQVRFRLQCTKGTYVRTLCADIGAALGCGAHLAQLRRTHSGAFTVERALTRDQLVSFTRDQLAAHIIPLHQVRPEDLRGV